MNLGVNRRTLMFVGGMSLILCSPVLPIGVRGTSMEPTVAPQGDILLYCDTRFVRGGLQRGDVVIARDTREGLICKRIVGLEGDIVGTAQVPAGFVWLEGDNARTSIDSRHYGALPLDTIQGKAFFRCFPLDRVGPIHSMWPPPRPS